MISVHFLFCCLFLFFNYRVVLSTIPNFMCFNTLKLGKMFDKTRKKNFNIPFYSELC